MRSLNRELTKEYWIARERVPDIVAIESDPLKHLRTDNGDVRNAATRAALYWKNRRRYLGRNDRWLLPMAQTGTGALSKEDIQVLRSGYMVVVTLHSGQQVLMIDPSRLGGRDPGESRERCIYYLCTNEINERSARSGIEIIFLLTGYGLASERHTEMINVLYTGMPTKVRHLTIVQSIEEGRNELLDFLAFTLERTYAMFTPTSVTTVKVDSRKTVLDALERRGIGERYLPKQLGGDFDYSLLSEWIQTRLVVENAMWASLSQKNALPATFRHSSKGNNTDSRVFKKGLGGSKLKIGRDWPRPCIASMFWRDIERKQRESSSSSLSSSSLHSSSHSTRRSSRKSKKHRGSSLAEIFRDDKQQRYQKNEQNNNHDDEQKLHEILFNALNDAVPSL